MTYRIEILRSAQRDLARLDQRERRRIIEAIRRLVDFIPSGLELCSRHVVPRPTTLEHPRDIMDIGPALAVDLDRLRQSVGRF